MAVQTVRVVFGDQSTPYLYGAQCVDDIVAAIVDCAGGADSVFFVVDRRVLAHAEPLLHGLSRRLTVCPFVLDAAESHKRLSIVESLLEHAVECGIHRGSLMIAMGGGLVGNTAGLAAALLYRGIRLIHLPTSPVAAFDAVLSQKQAVNLRAGKNLCGVYLAPTLIACDLTWLTSIPRRSLLAGVAEMAKNMLAVVPDQEDAFVRAVAALGDRPLDALRSLCGLGIEAKLPMLARDPRERHDALIFEYGHTVGHAIENVTAGAISHGEAIAWGMLVAAEVSAMLGHLDEEGLRHHHRVVDHLELPPPRDSLGPLDRAALRAALAADNKRGYVQSRPTDVPMVLLLKPGVAVRGPEGRPLTAAPEKIVMSAFDAVARG